MASPAAVAFPAALISRGHRAIIPVIPEAIQAAGRIIMLPARDMRPGQLIATGPMPDPIRDP